MILPNPIDIESSATKTYSQSDIDYSNFTEEEAYLLKENEIIIYGDNLILNAYANPQVDLNVNPNHYLKKVNRIKSNKMDKLAGDIALTQEEKDEAKLHEKLSEYEIKISDDQDKAINNLHKIIIVSDIIDFNIIEQSWNTWTPPI